MQLVRARLDPVQAHGKLASVDGYEPAILHHQHRALSASELAMVELWRSFEGQRVDAIGRSPQWQHLYPVPIDLPDRRTTPSATAVVIVFAPVRRSGQALQERPG
jgi:hypothetical protein